jgi:DNA-binding transcriptional regulator/RsmH inhibitor MraZ
MAESASPQPIFCDEFEHKLDSAWRVVLPKDWRSFQVTEFYVTHSSASSGGAALRVFTRAGWQEQCESLKRDPELQADKKTLYDLLEQLSASSKRVVPDKEGRLVIPDTLWKKIGVSPDDNDKVTLRGGYDSFRIWNSKVLKEYENAKAVMEQYEGKRQTAQERLGL